MIYNLFPKFQMRHEGFSFYGPRKSDEGGDTDLIYNFCWPYETSYLLMNLLEDGVSSDLSLGGLPGFLLGSPVFMYGGGLHKSSATGRLGGRPLPLPLPLPGVPVLRGVLTVAGV